VIVLLLAFWQDVTPKCVAAVHLGCIRSITRSLKG
jgi:hypothetical protein